MWSDSYSAEERGAHAGRAGRTAPAVAVAVAGLLALAAEVVFSVQIAGDAMSSPGWWPVGLVSIGLGIGGPYASLLAWRMRTNATKPPRRRLTATGLVAVVAGLVALAWLLLIRSLLPPNLHLF